MTWFKRPTRTMRQPEKAEQAAIIKLLEALGAKVYVLGTKRRKGDHQGTMQTPGIPDLYVVMPPSAHSHYPMRSTPVWIEVKAPSGRSSQAQRQFAIEARSCVIQHVMGGVDDVINWLVDQGWLPQSERRAS